MSILTNEEVQRIREDIFRQFAIPKEVISGEEPPLSENRWGFRR